jgi:hypothetical protein
VDYFEAVGMYQEFAVNVRYAELEAKTEKEVMKEWALKHGRKKILECLEALIKELEEKKEHYLSVGKIALLILKEAGK